MASRAPRLNGMMVSNASTSQLQANSKKFESLRSLDKKDATSTSSGTSRSMANLQTLTSSELSTLHHLAVTRLVEDKEAHHQGMHSVREAQKEEVDLLRSL